MFMLSFIFVIVCGLSSNSKKYDFHDGWPWTLKKLVFMIKRCALTFPNANGLMPQKRGYSHITGFTVLK